MYVGEGRGGRETEERGMITYMYSTEYGSFLSPNSFILQKSYVHTAQAFSISLRYTEYIPTYDRVSYWGFQLTAFGHGNRLL